MRPFTAILGIAVAVDRANVDTDVLIPINRLIGTPPAELGRFLFEPWRYQEDGTPDPGFPLNQPRYAGTEVLVAGANFGCGSSREHAVWALASYGIRCVVAPTFGDGRTPGPVIVGRSPEGDAAQQACPFDESLFDAEKVRAAIRAQGDG